MLSGWRWSAPRFHRGSQIKNGEGCVTAVNDGRISSGRCADEGCETVRPLLLIVALAALESFKNCATLFCPLLLMVALAAVEVSKNAAKLFTPMLLILALPAGGDPAKVNKCATAGSPTKLERKRQSLLGTGVIIIFRYHGNCSFGCLRTCLREELSSVSRVAATCRSRGRRNLGALASVEALASPSA